MECKRLSPFGSRLKSVDISAELIFPVMHFFWNGCETAGIASSISNSSIQCNNCSCEVDGDCVAKVKEDLEVDGVAIVDVIDEVFNVDVNLDVGYVESDVEE